MSRQGDGVGPVGFLPKNFLRPCLLLLIREESSHGYDLLVRLEELGFPRTDQGGLYRALRAMEQEGLVGSSWEFSDAGPPRRRYELTEDGRDWLHAWASSLRETGRIISTFLGRYEDQFGQAPPDPMEVRSLEASSGGAARSREA